MNAGQMGLDGSLAGPLWFLLRTVSGEEKPFALSALEPASVPLYTRVTNSVGKQETEATEFGRTGLGCSYFSPIDKHDGFPGSTCVI